MVTGIPTQSSKAAGAVGTALASHALSLVDEAATAALGAALGPALVAGDVVCLYGGLGAGKSALARAAIRARLRDPTAEVPSPTYTLINVYEPRTDAPDAIWHADLYRLGDVEELAELGLDEAFGHAVCLIEWAGRLARGCPARRLDIALSIAGSGRRAEITAHGSGWAAVMAAVSSLTVGSTA
ncbi:MAG: tRNA (adenosine(37)-N6)-threonylcarbamoyltransferase complex ATPase subunit type 1 TsaE [Pseudomonadota bacterium]